MEQAISFERIPTRIFDDSEQASKAVAHEIAALIREKNKEGKPTILGLATGSSPKKVYQELIRMHKEEGLSFKNVITFNLDEYHPMEPDSIQSYVRFMREQLFDHIDIPVTNYHIPDGTLTIEKIPEFCRDYEAKIEKLGGFDFYLLGIGRNGHIGFNEPGSVINSKTRLMTLDITTKIDAAIDFGGLEKVPKRAITLGIDKIMQAKRIVLLAWGEHKAQSVAKAVEGPITSDIPATYLQQHPNTLFILDETAASLLTRIKTPWLVDSVTWDRNMIKKAVTHLSLHLGKPVLKLTSKDYNEHGMSDLLSLYGQAYDINIEVFNYLQHSITGWPGGKPNADDTHRPERAFPAKKKVIIFSPHPDDDIISMGGTFQRLHDQGHDVHVVYQTSGNIAVADDEALRFAEFVVDFNEKFESSNAKANKIYKEAVKFLKNKKDSELDIPAVREIKGLIRQGEAKNTCRFVGIKKENAHFLHMPFYETGTIRKKPIGEADIQLIMDIIEEVQPHQIYAAGDLADPHGTHKVCLDAIFEAIQRLKHREYMKNCWVWLYKGAWAEWDIDQIEMAVPMSPDQVFKKRMGIFKHQSQKDGVVFQGEDSREFWQRAEERNRGTAQIYNALGLAEYEAMEAFVRWKF
ncbi:glucosamine-6-phosphate deaminase [Aquirufa regiilacus]|uniref:Glucosamine-6-phosphate deaminase n=1 Tax=Aquirufa regiilacus TaxID=3024868 RepID=A0ABU3TP59_9BACT|nr:MULTISPECIES: glucosamine-6-phosphate deaminase [unclassified Aquirufa]MBP6054353.1 glucosamine-6-phosphate deaminase [Cytophagaceae bacterium]MBP6092799.1 glucosamine-6-phosphate deaminase [Cytophagaceae bacterium]MDT8887099.1 glucosamine-6-phosphate deaminase [Aquirufa sp. LEPPI-3A]MDU0807624.1 glucosamine-6-phosphate deaminase [Aquirufa sp. LEOWEIH-7C]